MSDILRRLRLSNGVMLDAEREEAAAEIERLRGQVAVWLECYQVEKTKRKELVQRVREALGE